MESFHNGDTAPIRRGEELDVGALDAYLRETLFPLPGAGEIDRSAAISLRQFPGGHSNLTYLVSFGEAEFVLRRPPFGPVAPKAHDMPREFRLLAAVHPQFPLAPRPYLLCEDVSIIGVPFYLMERRKGLVIRRELPREIRDDVAVRRGISHGIVDTLADLHLVDIRASGLDKIGKPAGFVTRQVKGWAERWNRAKIDEISEIEEVASWLESRIPAEGDSGESATLVHNDFKLDNVMLDPEDPGKVVAVLDWEMCTVGDPLIDLGIFLCYWVERGDPDIRVESISPVTMEPGWISRREVVERYEQRTGHNLSNVAFYEVFAMFKLAVVLQQIYFRYLRGQTKDERFRDFGSRVRGLGRIARELVNASGQ